MVAGMIQQRHPHRDVEKIISVISFITVAISYPVYRNFESVLLSVVEIIVCERVTALILRTTRMAVKCEIVSQNLAHLQAALQERFAEGEVDYLKTDADMLLLVIGRRQLPEILQLLKEFPDAALYFSNVMGVVGKK